MTTEHPHPAEGGVDRYREDRSAINLPLLFHGLFWPAGFVFFVLAAPLTGTVALFVPAFLFGMVALLTFAPFGLLLCWSTDIRLTADGVVIGGIRRTAHRKARAASTGTDPWVPYPTTQRRLVFSCPWDAVQRIEVVTERTELKRLRSEALDVGFRAGGAIRLGRLWAPFMRAALVVNVDVDRAEFPRVLRQGEATQTPLGRRSNQRLVIESPVWFAPTRHPEKLAAALRSASGSGLLKSSALAEYQ
ncbi:hypothetical protein BIV57_12640 [Mangrovactinospora gilvigrisea]|uniref:DUF3093 domain-containing protein n=1 Tax=Mangrovactinospora gilvigrisea TaxID=1428644 RepID=A0A1J7BUM8_9ACTN|nr:hypothetical protein [Mangrovactinospora gilvigrisea]OIV37169.1 hypothetical protein BIV57_12640 [Mangrovactinospora gilvigrisea]